MLVADGEQRITIARSLSMPKVPVIRLNVADVDRRLLRQVLNKLRGEHDLIQDAYEFERIIQAGHEDELKHLLDLSDSQLERYLTEIREPKGETYEIPEIDKIKTDIQRGDIYKLGNHRLMCGDATQDAHKLTLGRSLELGFHDPPYGVNFSQGTNYKCPKSDNVYAPIQGDNNPLDIRFLLALTDNTIIWGGNYFAPILPSSSCWVVWDKQGGKHVSYADAELAWASFNKPTRIITHIWDGFRRDSEKGEKRIHIAQKPVKLLVDILHMLSDPKDRILDLFGGSGSTLIACQQTGRTCYMMEIDPRYCQVIIDRWEAYTGEKATKLD